MAERSFAKEVELLRLGDGTEFRGEGILAELDGLAAREDGAALLARLQAAALADEEGQSLARELASIIQPSQLLPPPAHARAI